MDVARVYDPPHGDELRVLVDRLWPRGISKQDPRVGTWRPEVAPSTDLRRWYGHRPERFAEFRERYKHELATPEGRAALAQLVELAGRQPVTLVTATRDVEHSQAAVLASLISDRPSSSQADAGHAQSSPDLDRITRWEDAGGTWQVITQRADRATISLCRCDGGEEADRFTSSDPQLLRYLADQ